MAKEQKRTIEQWRAVVAKWKGSGKSQRGFCRAEDLSYSAFSYWQRKLEVPTAGKLVKIDDGCLPGNRNVAGMPIIVRRGAIRVELSGAESEATLAKLFRALEASSCSSI